MSPHNSSAYRQNRAVDEINRFLVPELAEESREVRTVFCLVVLNCLTTQRRPCVNSSRMDSNFNERNCTCVSAATVDNKSPGHACRLTHLSTRGCKVQNVTGMADSSTSLSSAKKSENEKPRRAKPAGAGIMHKCGDAKDRLPGMNRPSSGESK